MKELELTNESQDLKLLEFSLNYALQEDPRFDEVGTTGEIAWVPRRLEPEAVLEPHPCTFVQAPLFRLRMTWTAILQTSLRS